MLRSRPGLLVHHEGVDPPIRRWDRARACVPGIDWSAAAGRSDPDGALEIFAGTTQEVGIALSAVLGAILAAPSASASAIGTDIRSCFATDPTSD